MADHIILDANRQPTQIRCLHCGFAHNALPFSPAQ